jgi:hypothetical protein
MQPDAWKGNRELEEEDCAAPNFSYQVWSALNFRFHNWWSGRGGPMLWPPNKVKTSHRWIVLVGIYKNLICAEKTWNYVICERINTSVATVTPELLQWTGQDI